MDLQKIIAALPWLRRLWRWMPGPLRIPLLVVALVVWLWRRGDDEAAGDETGDAAA